MIDRTRLDAIPENMIVLDSASLQERLHMPVPPNILTAVRSPLDPQHLHTLLAEEYPADHPLQMITGETTHALTLADLRQSEAAAAADYLIIPPLPDPYAFETFQDTVAILRGPHGCPWDKKQTHQSLRDDILQEVYELLDGLDRMDQAMIIEELGDVLLHILLQAQIGVDQGEFTMGEVISRINDKIISRHEHVFGRPENIDPNQVMQRWEQIKQKEREKQHKKGGLLDGISRAMPALSMAFSYQKRASKAGFDLAEDASVWEKLVTALNEFQDAETPEAREEVLGDILFSVVSLAKQYEIDPETALRMANLKFYERIHAVEQHAQDQGTDLFGMSDEEKAQCWNEYKNEKPGEE